MARMFTFQPNRSGTEEKCTIIGKRTKAVTKCKFAKREHWRGMELESCVCHVASQSSVMTSEPQMQMKAILLQIDTNSRKLPRTEDQADIAPYATLHSQRRALIQGRTDQSSVATKNGKIKNIWELLHFHLLFHDDSNRPWSWSYRRCEKDFFSSFAWDEAYIMDFWSERSAIVNFLP